MGKADGLDSGCRAGTVEALEGALDISTSDNLGQIILCQWWGGMSFSSVSGLSPLNAVVPSPHSDSRTCLRGMPMCQVGERGAEVFPHSPQLRNTGQLG